MKEILIYSGIYSFTAEAFIKQLNEVPKDKDIIVRLNSPGGSVFAGWGMIAALKERTGKNILKVDGNASSMAFFMVPFFDEVQALDVTSFMIHRATAYITTDEDQKMLDDVNSALRKKLEKRLDKELFSQVTGISIKDIFEAEERKDIWLDAKQAKKIGLVDKVVRLQPREMEAIQTNLVAFSTALHGSEAQSQGSDNENKTEKNNHKSIKIQKMNLQTLKSEHPDLVSAIITEERERVQAWLEFLDIDAEAVKKGIDSGENMSNKDFAAFNRKLMASQEVKKIEEDSPEDVEKKKEQEAKSPEEAKAEKELKTATIEVFKAAGVTNLENI